MFMGSSCCMFCRSGRTAKRADPEPRCEVRVSGFALRAPRNDGGGAVFVVVIASVSEAIQNPPREADLDRFVAGAPRNDGGESVHHHTISLVASSQARTRASG